MNVLMPLCFAAGCATTVLASLLIAGQPAPAPAPPAMQDLLLQQPPPLPPLDGDGPMAGVPQEQAAAPTPAPQQVQQALVRVTRTDRKVERTHDPIWDVQLVVNGQPIQTLEAVVGRANKQQVNRHIAGTEAPLPPGQYRIDQGGIAGGPYDNPELGSGLWIPVTPLFRTGRSALGFHQDPSWGLLNGESGTSGCIGFRRADETQTLVDWIRRYNIRSLVVTN